MFRLGEIIRLWLGLSISWGILDGGFFARGLGPVSGALAP